MFIDEIIHVINLDKRWDRLNKLINNYPYLNIKRFRAVKRSHGLVGCALSHIRLVKYAKQNNLPYIIVTEDDILINDKKYFIKKLTKILSYLKRNKESWDLFNGGISNFDKFDTSLIKTINTIPNIIEYKYGNCLHFVIYNNSSYDPIINLEKYYLNKNLRNKTPIDVIINRIIKRKWTTTPYLCYQRSGFSNIGRKMNNNYLILKKYEVLLILLLMKKISNR